jgi:hypothetical protein
VWCQGSAAWLKGVGAVCVASALASFLGYFAFSALGILADSASEHLLASAQQMLNMLCLHMLMLRQLSTTADAAAA